jgi:hypothetical protein
MATTDPLQKTHSESPISAKTFHIAGILTVVHGLEELSPSCESISVLWLLHPRLSNKDAMASTANKCINDWNQRTSSDEKVGLIAVAFDQRNHSSREVDSLANQAWRDGNVRHAQDMFRSPPSYHFVTNTAANILPVYSMAQLLIRAC